MQFFDHVCFNVILGVIVVVMVCVYVCMFGHTLIRCYWLLNCSNGDCVCVHACVFICMSVSVCMCVHTWHTMYTFMFIVLPIANIEKLTISFFGQQI